MGKKALSFVSKRKFDDKNRFIYLFITLSYSFATKLLIVIFFAIDLEYNSSNKKKKKNLCLFFFVSDILINR